ncbi:MAG: DUF2281 domain-containing protein [Candidatus Coatesbacteria bacterium]|nr:MAG: DUF2281 domain-containing protein [Candidatus Coatesbacteria bacterium]
MISSVVNRRAAICDKGESNAEDGKVVGGSCQGPASHLQEEVRDFANFLLQKRAARPRRKPKFDWARGLKELRDEYNSVELQHRASEWRTDKQ